jgi:hypothetical protein
MKIVCCLEDVDKATWACYCVFDDISIFQRYMCSRFRTVEFGPDPYETGDGSYKIEGYSGYMEAFVCHDYYGTSNWMVISNALIDELLEEAKSLGYEVKKVYKSQTGIPKASDVVTVTEFLKSHYLE